MIDKSAPQPEVPPPSYNGPIAQGSLPIAPPPNLTPDPAVEIGKDYQARLFARCARGEHEQTTEYGLVGILVAVFCFPIGLICLLHDSHKKCSRCGVRI